MASTESLIQDLSAQLAPVQRRNIRLDAGLLLALCAAELALVMMSGGMRPDMVRVILSPFMVWKIGGLTLLAVVSCIVAMRSFVPPAPSKRGLMLTLGLAVFVMIGGGLVTPTVESGRSVLNRLSPAHGILCATAIVALAMPIIMLLAILMRRAAPVRPERSAWAAGLAASTCGALLFTACCPMNDPLYIVVWYSTGVAVVTAASRWLLPRRFRL
jgi:hypothetical protein